MSRKAHRTNFYRKEGEIFERLPAHHVKTERKTKKERVWKSHQAMHEAMSTHSVGVDFSDTVLPSLTTFDKVRANRSFVNIHGVNIEIAEAQRQFHGDQKYHAKHVLRKIHHSKAEKAAKKKLKEEIDQLDHRLQRSERKLKDMDAARMQQALDKLEDEISRRKKLVSKG
jgi:thiamine pyrophosphate-dependent acetolactate synthase large subunit-like protein